MATQMANSDALGPGGPAAGPLAVRTVVMVTPQWVRNGGVSTHVQASAAALASHGVAVTVLAGEVEAGEPRAGVSVIENPALLDGDAPMSARIGDGASTGADVIHLHQMDDPDLVDALRERAPVIISAHGYTACTSGVYYFRPGQECTRAHGPGCIGNLVLRGCAHTRDPRPLPQSYRQAGRGLRALQRSDLAVSYSSAVDRHLAANGIDRRRTIPLFTTMHAVSAEHDPARRRVVFAGRVVAAKGVGTLIRAAREVDAEFLICGDGWQLDSMRRLAGRLGVSGRVRFTGWLAAGDLAEELANASIVAVPSLWPEPFGLVGIEAFAAGRPVVASATGGIGDWLQEGISGLFVPPGDAAALARTLNELLADPDRQREMGRAGARSVAERFTPEHHISALLEAYRAAHSHWAGAPAAVAA